jgi:hypothetical protein
MDIEPAPKRFANGAKDMYQKRAFMRLSADEKYGELGRSGAGGVLTAR